MKTKGPNSFDNFFSEPQYYPENGYVFNANIFNQQQAEQYFVDWLMQEWQWIPRANRKYVFNEIRRHIQSGWVKWHGYIDDDGEMHNGWVLYHEWKGGQKGFRHVYVVSFQKHYIEHGHHYEPLVSDWGIPRTLNDRDCLVCGQLGLAKLQGAHAEIIYLDEALMFQHPNVVAAATNRKEDLEKRIGHYDSYK